jgi:hypothetical protein
VNEKESINIILLIGGQRWGLSTNIMGHMLCGNELINCILEFWSFVLKCPTTSGVKDAKITLAWVFGRTT